MAAQPVSLGRIVLYVLPTRGSPVGEVRPAIVTRVFSQPESGSAGTGLINAAIVLDGRNDLGEDSHAYTIAYSEGGEPGTWRWPAIAAGPR